MSQKIILLPQRICQYLNFEEIGNSQTKNKSRSKMTHVASTNHTCHAWPFMSFQCQHCPNTTRIVGTTTPFSFGTGGHCYMTPINLCRVQSMTAGVNTCKWVNVAMTTCVKWIVYSKATFSSSVKTHAKYDIQCHLLFEVTNAKSGNISRTNRLKNRSHNAIQSPCASIRILKALRLAYQFQTIDIKNPPQQYICRFLLQCTTIFQ